MGNAELFELYETIPKLQCSVCHLYWNQGIVYCICGHLLKESEASHHFHQWRLNGFSIELEERVYARCPQHMSTTTNTAQPQGLALCSRCIPAWASEGTPVGPVKDTHGTLGPGKRGGRGWPTTTAQRAKCRTHQTVQNTCLPTNMEAEHVTIEEKLADEDSDKMIEETDVDEVQ